MLSVQGNHFENVPYPVLYNIYSNIKRETPSIFRKIEGKDEQVLINIGLVCKAWHKWVFDTNEGLFEKYQNVIKLLPKKDINWKRLLGIVNQEIMKHSEANEPWFQYIDSVRQGIEAECPTDADPNVLNYDGDSPYSLALSLCLKDKEKYRFLINQLPAANISDAILARAFTTIFKSNVNLENLIEGADRVVAHIKENGNERLLHLYLKPEIKNIFKFLCAEDRLTFALWLEKIGVELTVDALSHLLISTCSQNTFTIKFLPILLRLFNEMNIPLDEELESGEHLIHNILNEPELPPSVKSEFVQIILKKFPQEINIRDKTGKRLLSILFVRGLDHLYEDLKSFINEDVLMEQREECHTIIKSDLTLTRIKDGNGDFYDKRIQKIVDYFMNLKNVFPSQNSFEKWLLEYDEESFLHEIAFWHPLLIEKMLKTKLIASEMCETKNLLGDTIFGICERQSKLYEAFKNQDSEIEIDHDSYAFYNDRVKKFGEKPFIFYLFENANRSASLKSPLLKKLILLEPNITDFEENTLLHAFLTSNFCTSNKKNFLLYLLDYGVDPNQLNDEGKSPLDIARKFNRTFAYPLLQGKK